jgi:hypothetical protein
MLIDTGDEVTCHSCVESVGPQFLDLELIVDRSVLTIRFAFALAGAVMLVGEIVRYRRRRQNPQLAQDPATDRWLRRLGWCAVVVLGFFQGILVNVLSGGPRWLTTILFIGLSIAVFPLFLSVIVVGWRNGIRIARLWKWL